MVKIDTKEFFRIFHLTAEDTAVKMSEALKETLLQKMEESPGHAIVILPETEAFSSSFFTLLEKVASTYSTRDLSFIVTPVSANLEKKHPVWEQLNHTPTLREAIDLVMMEKIERELGGLDDMDPLD